MSPVTRLLLASLVVGALVAAPAASALYVVTPLKIRISDNAPEVGDAVTLTLLRDPEYKENTSLAGRTVTVRYSYDPNEGEENSTPPAEGEATSVTRDIGTVTLDAKEGGTLAWTIPAELDRHNAFLTAVDENGEDVGVGYSPVAVGDAPPMMMIMAGGGGGSEPEPLSPGSPEPAPGAQPEPQPATGAPDGAADTDTTQEPGTRESAGGEKENATPGVGLAALVAVAGIAALALRRRG